MKHARKTRQSSTLEVGSSTRRAVLGRGLALGAGAVAFGRAPALLGFSEPDPVRIGIVVVLCSVVLAFVVVDSSLL